MMRMRNQWLKLGGILSFAVAFLHVASVFVGAAAYRYFGAGEDMSTAAESGSAFPALLTLFLAAIFAIWGFYGLSGAGVVRQLNSAAFIRETCVVSTLRAPPLISSVRCYLLRCNLTSHGARLGSRER